MDFHFPVNSFAHIIDRQGGRRYSCHSLHLYSGMPGRVDLGSNAHLMAAAYLNRNFHAVYGDCVAQRNQLSGPLGRHNSRNSGAGEHLAFSNLVGQNFLQGVWLHFDHRLGGSGTECILFSAYINHVDLVALV